jgi:hypothetical protein
MPRIDVRGKLGIGSHDDVARLQWKRARSEVETESGVGRECDLRRLRTDETRAQLSRAAQRSELKLRVELVHRPA